MITRGIARIWNTEPWEDSTDGNTYYRRTIFDVVQVQVLQFLSEDRVVVAMSLGGTPFVVDVEDLSVVNWN